MSAFAWTNIIFLVFTLVIVLLVSRGDPDGDTLSSSSTIEELRSRQISGLREHALTQKFQDAVNERADYKKRNEAELELRRAGLDKMSYTELIIIKIGLSILALLTTWLLLETIVITVIAAFGFYMLPTQLVKMISNRRTGIMEKDIGTFIQLTTERYKVHGDFQKAVKQSAPDFEGQEPMYSEIRKTILDFNVGIPTAEALENMAERTGSKFIGQLSSYYEIASTIGTESSRDKIIGQAWVNFDDDYKMRQQHEQEIDGPKKDAYIILAALPLMMLYMSSTQENYWDFWLNTGLGQFGLGVILISIILSLTFISKKIGAPLD